MASLLAAVLLRLLTLAAVPLLAVRLRARLVLIGALVLIGVFVLVRSLVLIGALVLVLLVLETSSIRPDRITTALPTQRLDSGSTYGSALPTCAVNGCIQTVR